jgi:geranylgeranyl diphosphate synthase type I
MIEKAISVNPVTARRDEPVPAHRAQAFSPHYVTPERQRKDMATPNLGEWLKMVVDQTERQIEKLLELSDEESFDPSWSEALLHLRAYSLRPSKRLRPGLVVAGYAFGRGEATIPAGVWKFAAATELLHTFMLIHDDIADQADLRRGALTLHKMLAPGRMGEDLAVIAGDHLFARATEVMLTCNLPQAQRATSYFLKVCRHTAAGQFLDIKFSRAPLAEISLFQSLKVAYLKTALYGFSAPLVCGAMLAKADQKVIDALDKLGRQVGLAYQLQDDLIGLYGQVSDAGKSTSSDLEQGKRTFPVLAAYTRASEEERREFDAIWTPGEKDAATLARARALVELHGGRAATERIIQRATRQAMKIAATLPNAGGMRDLIGQLMGKLVGRKA